MSIQKTPLHSEHLRLGGRMVDFAGWDMPVEFEGLRQEHHRVRQHVGLFDVSHMGEVRVSGPKALESLQWMTSNDVSKLQEGRAQYSLLTNEEGGIVDDIIIYCLKPNEEYFVCVNAANIEKDFQWMQNHNKGATLNNESDRWAQVAIQGPKARDLTCKVLGESLRSLKPFHFLKLKYKSFDVMAASTGYTGEDGFEVFIPKEGAEGFWQDLLELGKPLEVAPIGLGARDTLRTEMKYSLYGHEIDDTTSPIEAGLSWVVKAAKGDFVGRGPITQTLESGAKKKLVGFKMVDKGIPRMGYSLLSFDKTKIGTVTSGTLSPSLNCGIGVGYVPIEFSKEGSEIMVDIRGRLNKAVVVKTPFVETSLTKKA